MAIYHGFITNDDVGLSGSKQAVLALKNACEAEGWETLVYTTNLPRYYQDSWVGKSSGLSGEESVIVGAKSFTYDSAPTNDHVSAAAFPVYDTNIYYTLQPFKVAGSNTGNTVLERAETHCLFSDDVTEYYILVNAQRYIMIAITNENSMTFTSAGKMFGFSKPEQYPQPLFALNRITTIMNNVNQVFSKPDLSTEVANLSSPYVTGVFSNEAETIKEVDDVFTVFPVYVISEEGGGDTDKRYRSEVYGQIDGIFACTGEGSKNFSVIQIGGTDVDIGGLDVLAAVAAINAAGGDAYFACFNGASTSWRSATCFLME